MPLFQVYVNMYDSVTYPNFRTPNEIDYGQCMACLYIVLLYDTYDTDDTNDTHDTHDTHDGD